MKSLRYTALCLPLLLSTVAYAPGCESSGSGATVSIEVVETRALTDANAILPENGVFLELVVRVSGEEGLSGLVPVTAQEFFVTDASSAATLTTRVFGADECGDANDAIVAGGSVTCSLFFDVATDFLPSRLTYLNQAGGNQSSTALGSDALPAAESGGTLFNELDDPTQIAFCQRYFEFVSWGDATECPGGGEVSLAPGLCSGTYLPIRYRDAGIDLTPDCLVATVGGCTVPEVLDCLEAIPNDLCIFEIDEPAFFGGPPPEAKFIPADHPCSICAGFRILGACIPP